MRIETIGAATLYLGDCRESVACRACDWVWKPSGTHTTEPCPKCGKVRDVRKRKHAPRNVEALAKMRAAVAPCAMAYSHSSKGTL